MLSGLDLEDLDLTKNPVDIGFLWTLRSQVTIPALAMIGAIFGDDADLTSETGELLRQVEEKVKAMDNTLKRLYEEAPAHNEKISGKGRGISMKEQKKESSGAVYEAFGQFQIAFFRLSAICDICSEGTLDGNPEIVDILADMVKHGLEWFEIGMKTLTDEYSDLKEAPEAEPESNTSEA